VRLPKNWCLNKGQLSVNIYKWTVTVFKYVFLFFLFFALLFGDGVWGLYSGILDSIFKKITAVFSEPETQWMIYLCLGINFTTLLILDSYVPSFWRIINSNLWLTFMLLVSTFEYAINYAQSTQALILIAGAVIGHGIAIWATFESPKTKLKKQNVIVLLIPFLLVILLVLASVWNANSIHFYEYRGYARWSLPWHNPNIFGLLMGSGMTLALGLGAGRWKMAYRKSETKYKILKLRIKVYVVVILCFIAAILMARGLLHSYSRGAWLAVSLGLAYFLWHLINDESNLLCSGQSYETHSSQDSTSSSQFSRGGKALWIRENRLPLSAILAAVFVLSFWHFRETNFVPARRAFSMVNSIDFSWRNRIAAWEGALQIAASHPWLGAGWNQSEPLYEYYYLSPKLNESGAIETNDYLMLGATLGIPALFCFGIYLWLLLARKPKIKNWKLEIRNQDMKSALQPQFSDFLSVTCRTGAIVLLVGFWIDGGLFNLPTAATFWILLELGSVELPKRAAMQPNEYI